jgi:hypothetical protein
MTRKILDRIAAQQAGVERALKASGRALVAAAGGTAPRARGRAINRPEQALQILVVDYLRQALIGQSRVWFCPNGGHLTPAQRGIFKRMGLQAGVGDLHIIWEAGGYGVIELKRPGGAHEIRETQTDFGLAMTGCGHRFAVCDSLEGVVETLLSWGAPLNPRVRI